VVYLTTVLIAQDVGHLIVNWKGCGRKRSWYNLRYVDVCLEKLMLPEGVS